MPNPTATPLPPRPTPPLWTPADTGFEHAGFGVRFVARLIDWGLLFAVQWGLGLSTPALVAWLTAGDPAGAARLAELGQSQPVTLAYAILCVVLLGTVVEGLASTSLGKQLMGLGIVSQARTPISPLQALGRNLALCVDGLFFGAVGFITIRNSPTAQRNGDAWAKTWVVARDSAASILTQARTGLAPALLAGILALAALHVWALFLATRG